jgi:hypothetical protein
MWEPSQKARKDTTSTSSHVKDLLGRYAESLVPLHFLTVHEGKVKVIYGWRICRPMDSEGRRYAALMNDRSGGTGCLIPPKLVITKDG